MSINRRSLLSSIGKLLPEGFKTGLLGWAGYVRNRSLLTSTQNHYRKFEQSILSKDTISLACYVVFDSTFAASDLMERWIADERYNPRIVVIPDVSRGKDTMIRQYRLTKAFFVGKYGADYVVDGYDEEADMFIDPSDSFDLAYMANPYDAMVNRVHGIAYLSTRNILPFVINYCYLVDYYSYHQVIQKTELSLCWKVFSETEYTQKAFRKYQLIHGKNVVLSGYSKMDALSRCPEKAAGRKTIIIAPHHTVAAESLPLSNFLSYATLIPELAERFPDVQFVFRPHPLLFTNLVNGKFWTQEQVDAYLATLKERGIVYSFGGDYMPLFKSSDALIHDCGSFMVEYLFTGKPCCFVSKKSNRRFINPFGLKCLDEHFRAWSEKDIIAFIQDVVDGKRKETPVPAWFRKKVAVNYPHASDFIYEHLLEPVK